MPRQLETNSMSNSSGRDEEYSFENTNNEYQDPGRIWNTSDHPKQPNFNTLSNRTFLTSANPRSLTSHNDRGNGEETEKATHRDKSTRDVVNRFAIRTTVQGIGFIHESRRWYTKSFWIVVFLAALGATTYQSVVIFQKYLSFSTRTSVSIGYGQLNFPSVTVCNINPVRRSRVNEDDGILKEFVSYLVYDDEYSVDDNDADDDEDNTKRRRKKRQAPCSPGDANCPETPVQVDDYSSYYNNDDYSYVYDDDGGDCAEDDPRCQTPEMPCKEHDVQCQAKYPSLYEGDDPFLPKDFSFQDDFEDYFDYDDKYQDLDEKHYGDGNTSGSTRLAQEFRFVISNFYDREERAKLGHQAKTMILSCAFNGKACQYWDFNQFISTDYGNCYTFNSAFHRNTSLRAKSTGYQNGLSLLLYTESHEYIPGLTYGRGMRFVVHPFNTMPFVTSNGIAVKPGEETYVGMRLMNMTKLGGDYGKCGDGGLFSKSFGYTYTYEGCVKTCLAREVFRNCSCYVPDDPEIYNKKWEETGEPCTNISDWNCYKNQLRRQQLGLLDCECNQACRTLEYDVDISHNAWPQPSFWYGIVNLACERDDLACDELLRYNGSIYDREYALNDNFVYLHIYYRTLNYEQIEEKAEYELSQVMSDFGGTIGLYVGASFISGVEVLAFFVGLIVNCYKRETVI